MEAAWLRGGGRRAWAPWLPVPRLQSDVAPALYVNWLVAADRLASWVPAPLLLQEPVPGWGLVTIVAFQHGHFGPRALGPLRRLTPSPFQSNWRTYVRNPATGKAGVHFLTTTVSNPLYRFAARATADNVPMRPARGTVLASEGRVSCRLANPSCTLLSGSWEPVPVPSAGPWKKAFSDWATMLEFVVPQDRAMAVRGGRVACIELRLGIPRTSIQPLEGEVACPPLKDVVGDARPWSFWVPRVDLAYERQEWDQ